MLNSSWINEAFKTMNSYFDECNEIIMTSYKTHVNLLKYCSCRHQWNYLKIMNSEICQFSSLIHHLSSEVTKQASLVQGEKLEKLVSSPLYPCLNYSIWEARNMNQRGLKSYNLHFLDPILIIKCFCLKLSVNPTFFSTKHTIFGFLGRC